MKWIKKNIPLIVAIQGLFIALSPAQNQFQPGAIWKDNNGIAINAHGGGMLFHEGVYYWFGEHKVEGPIGNTAQVGVHVYQSKDLYQWEDKGIALAVSQDPKSEIVKGCIIERPKVIYNAKTNKFVMWFHLELKDKGYSAARSGVAVSDRPEGPYTYLESVRPNAGFWPLNSPEATTKPLSAEQIEDIAKRGSNQVFGPFSPENPAYRRDFSGGQMARDMTLFVDDDGKAYHIYSSEENGTLHISQLNEDYTKHFGHYIRVLPGDSNEAPALFKKGGKYYMIASGCSGWQPNAARLAVSDSIMGTWKKLGNPVEGTPEQKNNTFESQSTYVLPVPGKSDQFIFMGDRWRENNPIDGRYIWLPIVWKDEIPRIVWKDQWRWEDLN